MSNAKYKHEANERLTTFLDFEISFPFCYVTKCGKHHYRYMEDGRYEMMTIEENRCSMTFGNYDDTVMRIHSSLSFYLKTAVRVHTISSSEEFDKTRALYFAYYDKYLNATKYVAHEIENLIKLKTVDIEKDKKEYYDNEQSNDIIRNDNDAIDEPF